MNITELSEDTKVVMTIGELNDIIQEATRSARLEELKFVRGFVPRVQSIKNRIVVLEGDNCCTSREVVQYLGRNKKYKLTLLSEQPERQYLVRRA